MTASPLWTPSERQKADCRMTDFIEFCAGREDGPPSPGYDGLYGWSIGRPEAFWEALWDFAGIVGDKGDAPYIAPAPVMRRQRFFPQGRLNFAENLLKFRGAGPALVFRGEDKAAYELSHDGLYDLVSRLQQAFVAAGLQKGDRVGAVMPNLPETIALMLAVTSLGGIWSSCSPDFGDKGILDRFGQIEPKFLIGCDSYHYNGKTHAIGERLQAVSDRLPGRICTLVVPYGGGGEALAAEREDFSLLSDFIAPFAPREMNFTRFAFDHPLYILFSSGTTGKPKCIVHGAGGTLLQHVKEHSLHCGIRPGERLFYFTTCGWMMWNWLVSGLASGATLLLYDGSPFYPSGNVLFDYAEAEDMTIFGTSAKFIDAIKKAGLKPAKSHDLGALRLITSTGSPLAPESFDFVYSHIKSDIHLASIAGGTDIVACFILGNPLKPVWRGEIQGAALGMATDVFNDDGEHITGEKGELVCRKTFPSIPVGFWNDPGDQKFKAAYFERFGENVWHHGDFVEWTEHGGMIIHGRSDAVLNPGGVRIGTSEIYAVVEQIPQVGEALAVGQEWQDDVRIVLFVVLAEGARLDGALEADIRAKIRKGASPRHVPARIIAVADIPRTKSGKITELAVRDIIHGRVIKNREALANPDALELYRDLPQLRE